MTAGASGANPILSTWMANNSEPHYRRATSVALAVLAANLVCLDSILSFFLLISYFFQGSILSTWSFPTKDGPKFRKTTIMNIILYVIARFFCLKSFSKSSLSSCIIVIVCSLINMAYLSWRNRVKKRPGVRTKLLQKYARA